MTEEEFKKIPMRIGRGFYEDVSESKPVFQSSDYLPTEILDYAKDMLGELIANACKQKGVISCGRHFL